MNLYPFIAVQGMARHRVSHDMFSQLAAKVLTHDPPCMSDAQDWETDNAWLDLLAPPPDPATVLPALPEAACAGS